MLKKRSFFAIAGLAALFIVFVYIFGLSFINRRIMPSLISRVEARAKISDAMDLRIGSAQINPDLSIVLTAVELDIGDRQLFSAKIIRMGLSVLRLLGKTPAKLIEGISPPAHIIGADDYWDWIQVLAASPLMPRVFAIDDAVVLGTTVQVKMRHSPGKSDVDLEIQFAALDSAIININYYQRRVHIEARRESNPRLSFEANSVNSQSLSFSGAAFFTGVMGIYDGEVDFSGSVSPFETSLLPGAVNAPMPSVSMGALNIRNVHIKINDVEADLGITARGFSLAGWADQPLSLLPDFMDIEARLSNQPVRDLIRLLPERYLGDLKDARVDGNIDADLRLLIPMSEPGAMEWRINSAFQDFSVEGIPANYDLLKLYDGFNYSPEDSGQTFFLRPYKRPSMEWMLQYSERDENWIRAQWIEADEIRSKQAPGEPDGDNAEPDVQNPRYLYLQDMSPWIPAAVLTAEDGDFFFHKGVNFNTVYHAIAKNIDEGEIVFGASTISMQLIKNMYLNHERNFERKIQELLLVYLMERHYKIPKERILELYLNIVEMGPGLFGVGSAARHYFGKDASELELGEAVWIASILPSPIRYHRYFEQGEITEGWFVRIKSILDVMLERKRISDEDYQHAIREAPSFRQIPVLSPNQ